ncbi:LPXTG cell wall anchor domain-containing protein, partial [Streptomyces sp. NPDC001571]
FPERRQPPEPPHVVRGEGAEFRAALPTVEKHNVTVPQHRPARPVRRPLAGAAAATGLLLALAAPVFAGTAHADTPSPRPERAAPAAAAEPSAAPASPVKRAGESKRPAAAPAKPEASAPPTGTAAQEPAPVPPSAGQAEPSAVPSAPAAAPAPTDQKELAHTGASTTTNTVMGVGAGALILAGAGTVIAVRRRHQN